MKLSTTGPWTFGEALRAGIAAYRRHWRVLMAAVAISEIIQLAAGRLIQLLLQPLTSSHAIGLTFLNSFLNITLGLLVSAFFLVGLMKLALATIRGEQPALRWMFFPGAYYVRMLLYEFFSTAAFFLGFLFLIVPGLYLMAAFSLGRFYVVETKGGVVACARNSMDALRGRLTQMAGFLLVTGLVYSLGLLPGTFQVFRQIHLFPVHGAHPQPVPWSTTFLEMQLPYLLTSIPLYPIVLCALAFIYSRADSAIEPAQVPVEAVPA